MYSDHLSLPFQGSEAYQGLAEINGILHATPEKMWLEFQVKDALFGVVKSDAKTIQIPYHTLVDAYFKPSFWGSKFILQLNNLELLNKFPSAQGGVVKLKVKKRFKPQAKVMHTFVQTHLSENRLKLMDRHSDPFGGEF